MKKASSSTIYKFLGTQFADYSNTDFFKERLKEELNLEDDNFSIPKVYEELIANQNQKNLVDKIFFESILYGQLKNVFVDQLDSNPKIKVNDFKESMQQLIVNINKDKLDSPLEKFMSSSGFYLMEAIIPPRVGTTFLAGFDFKSKRNIVISARYLFVNVVTLSNGKNGYFLAGIDIDFENKVCLTLLRNIANIIDKTVDNDDIEDSIIRYYYNVRKILFPYLWVKSSISFKKDRKAMFNMCKDLDSTLLSEFRNEIKSKIAPDSVKKILDGLLVQLLPSNVSVEEEKREMLVKRVEALLLVTFLNTMADDEDLIQIARERKLVGFPTNIFFKSGNSAKGATGTSIKNVPISGEVMFHSLYTDFSEALELPKWSLSWFTDYDYSNINDVEVISTTIRSTKYYLLITFKSHENKYLSEGLIKHVVNYINHYRSGEE